MEDMQPKQTADTAVQILGDGFSDQPAQEDKAGDDEEWTEEHMRVLVRWKSQAFVHMYLQDKSNYHFRLIYNALTFPVILLSSISSATLFTSDDMRVKVFVATSAITCACLAALQRQVRPAEQAAEHAHAAHRYQTLIHRIESAMNMVPNMRPTVRRFVDKVRAELETLLATQCDPPRFVLARFEKRYGRVEGILYGDEIAEMIAQSIRAQTLYKRIEKVYKKATTGVAAASDVQGRQSVELLMNINKQPEEQLQHQQPPTQRSWADPLRRIMGYAGGVVTGGVATTTPVQGNPNAHPNNKSSNSNNNIDNSYHDGHMNLTYVTSTPFAHRTHLTRADAVVAARLSALDPIAIPCQMQVQSRGSIADNYNIHNSDTNNLYRNHANSRAAGCMTSLVTNSLAMPVLHKPAMACPGTPSSATMNNIYLAPPLPPVGNCQPRPSTDTSSALNPLLLSGFSTQGAVQPNASTYGEIAMLPTLRPGFMRPSTKSGGSVRTSPTRSSPVSTPVSTRLPPELSGSPIHLINSSKSALSPHPHGTIARPPTLDVYEEQEEEEEQTLNDGKDLSGATAVSFSIKPSTPSEPQLTDATQTQMDEKGPASSFAQMMEYCPSLTSSDILASELMPHTRKDASDGDAIQTTIVADTVA
jgi:hypothetical protein